MDAQRFYEAGWTRFEHEAVVAEWADRALPVARGCLADPGIRARWLRCGGTWFAGVNALPNDAAGAVREAGVPQLGGAPARFIAETLDLGEIALDRAQVSVCFPGYPQPGADESAGAYRFRRDRDAAHVDGLKRFEGRRRRLGEPHAFILGLPLTETPPDAAPFVVWEGSHELMRRALRERLRNVPPARWATEDLTDAYAAARRECFERCPRVKVHAAPGEAYLVHRLALHGVAPWRSEAPCEQRIIAYFRPSAFPGEDPVWWLERP